MLAVPGASSTAPCRGASHLTGAQPENRSVGHGQHHIEKARSRRVHPATKTRRSLRVSNSRLQIAFGINVYEFPISMPTLAALGHHVCSSYEIVPLSSSISYPARNTLGAQRPSKPVARGTAAASMSRERAMPLGLTWILVFATAIGPLIMCSTARSAKWRSPAPKYTPTLAGSLAALGRYGALPMGHCYAAAV